MNAPLVNVESSGGYWKTLLRWGVSIGLLALLFTRFDFTTILHVCLRATPAYFAGALLLYLLSQVISALTNEATKPTRNTPISLN